MKTMLQKMMVVAAICSAIACILGSTAAFADDMYQFSVTNNDANNNPNKLAAYDLEVSFAFTGGSVDNLNIIAGGGDQFGLNGLKNGYYIKWDNGLPWNGTSTMQFTAIPGIQLLSAEWTDLGFAGSGVNIPATGGTLTDLGQVPEPGTLLLLGSAVAGFVSYARRRLI